MVTAETVTTILANLATVGVTVIAGAQWIWKKMEGRFQDLEDELGDLGTTVALLAEAEGSRDPEFFDKVKRVGRTVGTR